MHQGMEDSNFDCETNAREFDNHKDSFLFLRKALSKPLRDVEGQANANNAAKNCKSSPTVSVREAVDPAKYVIVRDVDGTKYACSKCGNVYKWRKSLNKHWKEKHDGELPGPCKSVVSLSVPQVHLGHGFSALKAKDESNFENWLPHNNFSDGGDYGTEFDSLSGQRKKKRKRSHGLINGRTENKLVTPDREVFNSHSGHKLAATKDHYQKQQAAHSASPYSLSVLKHANNSPSVGLEPRHIESKELGFIENLSVKNNSSTYTTFSKRTELPMYEACVADDTCQTEPMNLSKKSLNTDVRSSAVQYGCSDGSNVPACYRCKSLFNSVQDLKNHYCDGRFSEVENLAMQATNENYYIPCKFCGASFYRNDLLIQHLTEVHSFVLSPYNVSRALCESDTLNVLPASGNSGAKLSKKFDLQQHLPSHKHNGVKANNISTNKPVASSQSVEELAFKVEPAFTTGTVPDVKVDSRGSQHLKCNYCDFQTSDLTYFVIHQQEHKTGWENRDLASIGIRSETDVFDDKSATLKRNRKQNKNLIAKATDQFEEKAKFAGVELNAGYAEDVNEFGCAETGSDVLKPLALKFADGVASCTEEESMCSDEEGSQSTEQSALEDGADAVSYKQSSRVGAKRIKGAGSKKRRRPKSCMKCGYITDNITTLQRHVAKHGGTGRFACTFCDYRVDRQHVAETHMRFVHADQSLPTVLPSTAALSPLTLPRPVLQHSNKLHLLSVLQTGRLGKCDVNQNRMQAARKACGSNGRSASRKLVLYYRNRVLKKARKTLQQCVLPLSYRGKISTIVKDQ